MKQFFERLAHTTKINLGNYIKLYLDILFKQKKGSAARLCQGLSSSQTSPGYDSKLLLEPIPLPCHQPTFFLPGLTEEQYEKDLSNYHDRFTEPAGIISVSNVNVSLPTGMHMWQGKVFEEALIGTELLTNPKYLLDLETIPFKKKTIITEPVVLLSLPWHHNFYHWLIEILPRLVLYELSDDLHGLRIIVPNSASKFVKASLSLTKYIDQVWFLDDGVYQFEKLHILSRLSKTGDVSPWAIKWLNENLVKQQTSSQKKRIYISRADAKYRFVTNESEVQNVLSDFGFETVLMTKHSLEEQIQIFQQAEIVVGSHGAAFAHAAFMKPGSVLIEFFQSGHLTDCFFRIANLKQLKYGFLVGQSENLGFSVDITQLTSMLEQALA